MLKNLLRIIFILIVQLSIAQQRTHKFEHFTLEDGLSNNEVKSITQDHEGFIWIGTKDGLNKYDGYSFKTYQSKRSDTTSLRGRVIFSLLVSTKNELFVGTDEGLDFFDKDKEIFLPVRFVNETESIKSKVILSLLEDNNGDLWIGTRSGLIKYNSNTKTSKVFKTIPGDDSSLSGHFVYCIYQDKASRLWIGTEKGLNRYVEESESFERKFTDNNPPKNTISDGFINTIVEDPMGFLWLGTESGGLMKYYPESDSVVSYRSSPSDKSSLSNNYVTSIKYSSKKELYITTYRGGINIYQPEQSTFLKLVHDPVDPYSLVSDNVFILFEDIQENLWVGTGNGLSCYKPGNKKFKHFKNIPQDKNSISSNTIKSIYEDSYGDLWIGTKESGLNRLNRRDNIVSNYLPGTGKKQTLSSKDIFAIIEDSNKDIWIGGSLGLSKYNRENDNFKNYQYNEKDSLGLISSWILSIVEEDDDHLWVGTAKGLYLFNKHTGKCKVYEHNVNNATTIPDNWVVSLYKDKLGYLWIGTAVGLSVFDANKEEFVNYLPSGDKYSLSNKLVLVIYEDSKSRFWIGTEDGLNLFDKKLEKFTSFHEKDGLPNSVINGICEDEKGNLWISTNYGISLFNPDSLTFINFDKYDGLQSNQFLNGSYFAGKTGELFFGGINGFNSFYPKNINLNDYIPNIVFTKFLVVNQEVKPGMHNSPLKSNINSTTHIELEYAQRFFGFSFVALNYLNPQKNRYKFILEGFDKNWHEGEDLRSISYTNVPPGKYVFKLMAANNDGVWNNQARELFIRVKPPWWLTWWAFTLYFSVFSMFLIGIRKYSLIGVNLKHQLMMEHFEHEKNEELVQLKIRFFTNISHELRTPLTLIISPLERLIANSKIPTESRKTLTIVQRNAGRILNLINQLIEFRKSETGHSKLYASENVLHTFLKNLCFAFNDIASHREINLSIYSEDEDLSIWVDKEKLERIIINLLSNAFKFTADKGKIRIDSRIIKKSELKKYLKNPKIVADHVKITVTDNGSGIAEKDIPNIFERFYQGDSKMHASGSGAGIGLALSRKLTELNYGNIDVKSTPGIETSFSVYLPLGKAHLSESEIKECGNDSNPNYLGLADISVLEKNFNKLEDNKEIKPSDTAISENSRLLIVEDNNDVREYLIDNLRRKYNVIGVSNGKEAIDIARKEAIDLIVSDVMMPVMDGIKLTEEIKSDILTSHIPIILLTANASHDYQKQGLELGADEYVIKPFNLEILELKIRNLIESRKNIKSKFKNKPELKPIVVTTTSADRKFLEKATLVIKSNMEDPNFGVELMSDKMAMSRSNLYRKINALTDQTTIEFIRLIRLREAATLLLKNEMGIYEVMDAIGFQNIKYFRKCFFGQYGIKPDDYFDYKYEEKKLQESDTDETEPDKENNM